MEAIAEEEIEFDEAVREVKKPPSGEGQPSKKKKVGAEKFGRPCPSKNPKSKLDEALKSRKLEGKYTIVPPISLSEIVDSVVKEGNLKHVSKCYENYDENDQRAIEAIVKYMNVYSKALIELSSMILKGLYQNFGC